MTVHTRSDGMVTAIAGMESWTVAASNVDLDGMGIMIVE